MKLHIKLKKVDFVQILDNLEKKSILMNLIKYIVSFNDGAAINFKLFHGKIKDELNRILKDRNINIDLGSVSLNKKEDTLVIAAGISRIDYENVLRILIDITLEHINKDAGSRELPEWLSFEETARALPGFVLSKLSDKELDVVVKILVNENRKKLLTLINKEIKSRGFDFYAANIAITVDS